MLTQYLHLSALKIEGIDCTCMSDTPTNKNASAIIHSSAQVTNNVDIATDYSTTLPKLKDVGSLALPMVVSQASETINMFVDRLFLSRLGKLHIAGAMTGGVMAFCLMSFFVGVISFVNTLVAQNDGAGNKRNCASVTSQGVWLAWISWPIIVLCIPLVNRGLEALNHSPELVALEISYLRILIYGSILELLRHALSSFFMGLGRTQIVMLANVCGMLVNIPANWILIFGKFGISPMGIEGAAIGTVIGRVVILTILLSIYFSKRYRKEFGTTKELGIEKKSMKLLCEYGAPVGSQIFLNVAAFNIFIQLMLSYDANTAAAVTIVFNYDMLAFFPMMGMGFAATTLTGRYMGAGNIQGAERANRLTIYTAWAYAAIFVILFSLGARPLVSLFTSGMEDAETTVAPLARIMLRLASIYTVADATQLIFSGCLQGAGDTKFAMWISISLHWVMVALVWYGIRVAHITPLSIWYIFIGFVLTMSLAYFLRHRFGPWRQIKLVE